MGVTAMSGSVQKVVGQIQDTMQTNSADRHSTPTAEAGSQEPAGDEDPATEGITAGRGPSSAYRGVTWNRKCQKWQATLNNGGRHIHLGTFFEEREAALAFDRAAIICRGLNARLNFSLANYVNAADGTVIEDPLIKAKVDYAMSSAPSRRKAVQAQPTISAGQPARLSAFTSAGMLGPAASLTQGMAQQQLPSFMNHATTSGLMSDLSTGTGLTHTTQYMLVMPDGSSMPIPLGLQPNMQPTGMPMMPAMQCQPAVHQQLHQPGPALLPSLPQQQQQQQTMMQAPLQQLQSLPLQQTATAVVKEQTHNALQQQSSGPVLSGLLARCLQQQQQQQQQQVPPQQVQQTRPPSRQQTTAPQQSLSQQQAVPQPQLVQQQQQQATLQKDAQVKPQDQQQQLRASASLDFPSASAGQGVGSVMVPQLQEQVVLPPGCQMHRVIPLSSNTAGVVFTTPSGMGGAGLWYQSSLLGLRRFPNQQAAMDHCEALMEVAAKLMPAPATPRHTLLAPGAMFSGPQSAPPTHPYPSSASFTQLQPSHQLQYLSATASMTAPPTQASHCAFQMQTAPADSSGKSSIPMWGGMPGMGLAGMQAQQGMATQMVGQQDLQTGALTSWSSGGQLHNPGAAQTQLAAMTVQEPTPVQQTPQQQQPHQQQAQQLQQHQQHGQQQQQQQQQQWLQQQQQAQQQQQQQQQQMPPSQLQQQGQEPGAAGDAPSTAAAAGDVSNTFSALAHLANIASLEQAGLRNAQHQQLRADANQKRPSSSTPLKRPEPVVGTNAPGSQEAAVKRPRAATDSGQTADGVCVIQSSVPQNLSMQPPAPMQWKPPQGMLSPANGMAMPQAMLASSQAAMSTSQNTVATAAGTGPGLAMSQGGVMPAQVGFGMPSQMQQQPVYVLVQPGTTGMQGPGMAMGGPNLQQQMPMMLLPPHTMLPAYTTSADTSRQLT